MRRVWFALSILLCAANVVLVDIAISAQTDRIQLLPDVALRMTPLDLSQPLTTEDIMTAGELGGALHPTFDLPVTDAAQMRSFSLTSASVSAFVRRDAMLREFGAAMNAWNAHQYTEAVEMFARYEQEFPDSPWVSEAILHRGCEAYFTGRYREAETLFQRVMDRNAGSAHIGAIMLTHKALGRLAVLRVNQNNIDEALTLFRRLHDDSPDWRDRTYASNWILRLSQRRAGGTALLNCGALALAAVLEQDGRRDEAQQVRQLTPTDARGYSLRDLRELAEQYGYHVSGRQVSASDLRHLPLPAIVPVSSGDSGDKGHYWMLEAADATGARLHDPQSGRRFTQALDQLTQEWQGIALIIQQEERSLPGIAMTDNELGRIFGACCGVNAPTDDLGDPGEHAGPQSGPGPKTPCGSPIWSVNMVSMNLYLHDVPLWYAPPIGPSVEISLSYNSQATLTQHEPFGKKWQFSYATYLVTDPGGTVTIFMPDGRRDVYSPDGSGGYTRPYRVYNTLRKLADNSFELRLLDDTTYRYGRPAGTTTNQALLRYICDPYNQCLSFGYDASVRLTTITDALNRVTTLSYNAAGFVSTVRDPFGRSASFDYANGSLTKITDMGGYWTELAYDANVYLASLTNPRGTWGFYVEPADEIPNNSNPYPAPGGVMWDNYRITVTNPEGGKEEYYYDAYHSYYDANAVNAWYVSPRDYRPYVSPQDNNASASTSKTTYKFTALNGNRGEIKSITSPETHIQLPDRSTVSYTYDSATGERASITFLFRTTRYTYNALGRVTTIMPPQAELSKITLGYAANNVDVNTITNSLGTVTLTYNAAHDVTAVTDRMNNVTSLAYNAYGQLASLTERLNGTQIVTAYFYDAGTHLLTQVTRAGQVVATYTYDEIGRVKTATDATGLTLTYAYNNLNHVTSITYPDGKATTYAYSGCCPRLIDRITERSGAATAFEYDGLTRLIKRTDPIGSVAFGYDANGNLTTLTDQIQHVTTFGYNLDNQLVRQTYQNGDTLRWEYALGFVSEFTNARGASISYAYDRNGNLTVVDYGTAMHYVGFEYDGADRLIKMTDALGDWTYGYNANSDLTSVDGPWANDTITYTYDTLGRRTGMTPQGGAALTYVYDALNRLTRVQFGAAATAPAYVYGYSGASPLVQSLTRPNGSITTYAYNALHQVIDLKNATSTGAVLTRHQLAYNSRDVRDTEQITGSAVVPLPAMNAMNSIESSNAVNQLVSRTAPAQAFAYDADGNLTKGFTAPLPGGVGGGYPFTATYDAENRLSSLTYKDGKNITQTFQYTYSGDGLPAIVKRLENGVVKEETRFARDGGLIIQERNVNNAVTRQYAWGLNLGGGIGGLLDMIQTGNRYSYLYDASGNVEAVLNASQQVVAAYRYDPFGTLLAKTGTFDQPFQFSTKRYDARIGMVQYEFRNYLPHLGRWATRDPLGEAGGLNLYAFVGNNPVNWVDPWGLTKIIMVGSNVKNPQFFNNIANAMAGIDSDTIIIQIRTPQHVQQALQYPSITQITYLGHSGPEQLDISPQSAVTKKDVAMLNPSNIQPGATIQLYGCRTGEGSSPIAQTFANHFQRPTLGMATGLSFGIPLVNRLAPTTPFFWWPRALKKWFLPTPSVGVSGN